LPRETIKAETLKYIPMYRHMIKMRVWIDISNTPHVNFFKGAIKTLESSGHEVFVTSRDFDGLSPLLNMHKIDHTVVGKHGGFCKKSKLVESSKRILELSEIISNQEIDLALYKHSVEGARVSYGLGIPSICVLDNETAIAQNKLMLPLSSKVIAPDAIPLEEITKYGVHESQVIRFNGFCEIANVSDFKYDDSFISQLGLSEDKLTIVMRPEPVKANYYNGNKDKTIIKAILEKTKNLKDFQFVVFPRFEEQKSVFNYDNVIIPEEPVDALSLMSYSDLVISAGGSMNREAVALNTPALTTYPEKLLAVTKKMIEQGLKIHLLDPEKITKFIEKDKNLDVYHDNNKKILSKLENPIDVISREIKILAI